MPGFAPIRQDDYPATDELQCIAVYIPAGDEYKALLAGFIAMLSDANNYEDPDSAQADGIASVFDTGYSVTNWDGCGVPPECNSMNTNVMLYPDLSGGWTGGNVVWVTDAASSLGGYFRQSPAATGDVIEWSVYLAPGRYWTGFIYLRDTGNGKGDFKFYDPSGAIIRTFALDMRGTLQRNTLALDGFDLPVGGYCRIVFQGTGSTGAGFIRPLQRVTINKYAEI